uniref:Uncharacterized protein n=1 Tax=Romanomermis culicivorax TaxID=13658 RepID=A0A915JSX1_ROMCU
MPQPVLLCPFTYEWPFNGHNPNAEQIARFLTANLGPLRRGRQKTDAQKTSIPDEIRRHLIFGTSQIIRNFQKENVLLSHVLFDRSLLKTPQIAFHLGQLASTKKSTFCAVLENLNDVCRPILRIKSCESIGILKNDEEKLIELMELIEKLTPLCVKSTNDGRNLQNSKRKLDEDGTEIQTSYIPPSVYVPESNEKRKKKKLKKKK